MTPPEIVTRAGLQALPDWDHARFRRDLRAGRIRRLRHGVYLVPGMAAGRVDGDGHALEVHRLRAALTTITDPGCVISHESAAHLHGLPTVDTDSRVRLTRPGRPSRRRPETEVRAAQLPAHHVQALDGMRVTTLERTLVDLARASPRSGLVAADHALRIGWDAAGLGGRWDRVLADCRGWPGITLARQVRELADGGAESALESVTRWFCWESALPVPDLQVAIRGPGWGYRVDGLLRAEGVIIECDGRIKYRTTSLPGAARDVEERVWRDKVRRDRLVDAGFEYVTVTWADVMFHPDQTAARIRAAILRARRRRGATAVPRMPKTGALDVVG